MTCCVESSADQDDVRIERACNWHKNLNQYHGQRLEAAWLWIAFSGIQRDYILGVWHCAPFDGTLHLKLQASESTVQ